MYKERINLPEEVGSTPEEIQRYFAEMPPRDQEIAKDVIQQTSTIPESEGTQFSIAETDPGSPAFDREDLTNVMERVAEAAAPETDEPGVFRRFFQAVGEGLGNIQSTVSGERTNWDVGDDVYPAFFEQRGRAPRDRGEHLMAMEMFRTDERIREQNAVETHRAETEVANMYNLTKNRLRAEFDTALKYASRMRAEDLESAERVGRLALRLGAQQISLPDGTGVNFGTEGAEEDASKKALQMDAVVQEEISRAMRDNMLSDLNISDEKRQQIMELADSGNFEEVVRTSLTMDRDGLMSIAERILSQNTQFLIQGEGGEIQLVDIDDEEKERYRKRLEMALERDSPAEFIDMFMALLTSNGRMYTSVLDVLSGIHDKTYSDLAVSPSEMGDIRFKSMATNRPFQRFSEEDVSRVDATEMPDLTGTNYAAQADWLGDLIETPNAFTPDYTINGMTLAQIEELLRRGHPDNVSDEELGISRRVVRRGGLEELTPEFRQHRNQWIAMARALRKLGSQIEGQ